MPKGYLVLAPCKEEGFFTFNDVEARYAAGRASYNQVEISGGLGVPTLADKFRETFEDQKDDLEIRTLDI